MGMVSFFAASIDVAGFSLVVCDVYFLQFVCSR
jgi:hypothetical protein